MVRIGPLLYVHTKICLGAWNKFFQEVERTSINRDFHVDFSEERRTNILNGFFNKRDVIDMLEAKDYDRIDMVSPFMGEIVERLCGFDNAPATYYLALTTRK